uniref:FHA domain-containing protein n=1 Tax=Glossina brevipalpis TaxID=37001 RepID=A0A1A9WET8_9MUSC
MVLVSNEWQNSSEDEHKSTADNSAALSLSNATTTTTATPATTLSAATTCTLPAIAAAGVALPTTTTTTTAEVTAFTTNTTTTPTSQTETIALTNVIKSTTPGDVTKGVTAPTTSASALALSELETITKIFNDNICNEKEEQQQLTDIKSEFIKTENQINDRTKQVSRTSIGTSTKDDNNLDKYMLDYNTLKIMSENLKESTFFKEEMAETRNYSGGSESDTGSMLEEIAARSIPTARNSFGVLEDIEGTSFSNTNTLLASSSGKLSLSATAMQSTDPFSGGPTITPEVLNSALQSVMNAANTGNLASAAGLQSSLLNQLGIGAALTVNVAAGLQKTAKQLNASLGLLENQTKNDINVTDINISSSGAPVLPPDTNGQARIVLICETNSHPFQTRTISLTPNVECMVGRLIAKSKAAENNAIFDCKVLSRKHAVIWYTPDGKFWVKDTKSSNGTFINDNKLGESEAELHFGDIVKFGVDVLENSRKEVHGCIIACVKLYLPDGREAISIDGSAHRNQYTGESRITFDELHRLNMYVQETSQREKLLTSKLCSIQNVLDATRKNSALCWQAMITEDQLLHRIHSLEKKLQVMEKNIPENVLRNEILKLLDDKNSYQHSAKEALRKVYQERCDAMQTFAKMESAYTQSTNECALLRDQIMNSKQILQDVNSRLMHLEREYSDYREATMRQQQEAKEHEEQRIVELGEKLRERELECSELKHKISELLIKRAELIETEEKLLEKQAIDKLDAAIADMGEDDDVDNDDDDDIGINDERDSSPEYDGKGDVPKKNGNNIELARPAFVSDDDINGIDEASLSKSQKISTRMKRTRFSAASACRKSPPKRVKESTIMKWLQNSDINKKEGSLNIFKAICNENDTNSDDSSDEDQTETAKKYKSSNIGDIVSATDETKMINVKCTNFAKKLKIVQKNLKRLEAEIENETNRCKLLETGAISCSTDESQNAHAGDNDFGDSEDYSDEEGGAANNEFVIKRNGKTIKVLSKKNNSYNLLKSSVNILREAYNEIWDSVKEQQDEREEERPCKIKSLSTPAFKVKQCDNDADRSSPVDYENVSELEDDLSSCGGLNTNSSISIQGTTKISDNEKSDDKSNHLLKEELQEYKDQIEILNEKLQKSESEAQHTLEIMNVECDDLKKKMFDLNKYVDSLKEDKRALEEVINENNINKNKTATLETEEKVLQKSTPTLPAITKELSPLRESTSRDVYYELNECNSEFRGQEIKSDIECFNEDALEREEELITYKERLEKQEEQNVQLQHELAALKRKASHPKNNLIYMLPYGAVVVALLVYFLHIYF